MPELPSSEYCDEQMFDPVQLSRGPFDAEFQRCSLGAMSPPDDFSVAGLFAGIGGIEAGLAKHGGSAELLCEYWEPAHRVLATQFPEVVLTEDVRDLRSLPKVDLVSAGFPCTDLSQAGRTAGINGEASGLVAEVFRLLQRPRPPMLMLENVRNMLVLDGGEAMRYLTGELEALARLEDLGEDGLPVVGMEDKTKIVGYLSRIKALASYNRALIESHVEHHR